MIVGVQGSVGFDNYQVFMRAMAVAMSTIPEGDNEFHIYSAGPAKINNFVAEFSNVTERSLKARGIKIRFFKVPPSWFDDNVSSVKYFAYLSKPGERQSKLADHLDANGVDVGLFRF
jgi:hypothetical protein